MTKGNDIKTIKLNREDIINNNFSAVEDELMRLILIYKDEYGE